MRALILRRVGLLETGAGGPVIVGRAENGDVIRLEGFLSRNGRPHQRLNPDTDPEAKALVERFQVDPRQLPIVLCPGGQLLRNPSETELARCIGLVGTPRARTRTLNARTGEFPSFASRRIDVPRGTRDEVSSRRALVRSLHAIRTRTRLSHLIFLIP